MSISFLFLRLKRKEIDERKEKERYGKSGFHPEARDLFDEFAHQSKAVLTRT